MSSITAALATPSTSQNEPASSDASRKRKIADAIHTLDEAIGPSTSDLSPPSKRHHGARSIYTTLAKYGIKTKEPRAATSSLSLKSEALVKAPHLSAILSRTASRRKKASAIASSSQTTALPGKEFSPSSVPSFIRRLGTFKLSTYGNKPPAIDAVAAAKRGWTSDGVTKDRLVCDFCGASWVVAGREGLSRDAAAALVEKQRLQLASMHKDLCPWKTRQCDDLIYRIPLKPPAYMAREVKSRALLLEPLLEGLQIRHPLTSTQVSALQKTLASVTVPPLFQPTSASQAGSSASRSSTPEPASSPPPASPSPTPTPAPAPASAEPSDTAALAALFGWAPAPPPPPSTSTSRFPSHYPSASSASLVNLSRSASVASFRSMGDDSPTPSISASTSVSRAGTPNPFSSTYGARTSSTYTKPENATLFCELCQRRVGLWTFIPKKEPPPLPPSSAAAMDVDSAPPTPKPRAQQQHQRPFDLLKEHRSYCPYLVRSTVIPTLPSPPSPSLSTSTSSSDTTANATATGTKPKEDVMEGWRAVLTVLSRYGLGHRARRRAPLSVLAGQEGQNEGQEEVEEEVDAVNAMIADVKKRGSRDLMKYVRSLLG